MAHEQFVVLHSSGTQKEDERNRCLERLRFLAPFNESHTVPVEHIVTSGEPGEVIVQLAKKYHVDLVDLGSPAKMLSEERYEVEHRASGDLQCFMSRAVHPIGLPARWSREHGERCVCKLIDDVSVGRPETGFFPKTSGSRGFYVKAPAEQCS